MMTEIKNTGANGVSDAEESGVHSLSCLTGPASARTCAPAQEAHPGAVAERLLMERHVPPFVVVNEKYQVVHVSSRASTFLEVPAGEPSRDVLKMAREELRPPLRAAMGKCFAEK